MRLISSIYVIARHVKCRIMSSIYRIRAISSSRLSGGTVALPNTVVAHAPLRIDGIGHVEIGASVMLGYRPAPRIGCGEILLQARGHRSSISIGAHTLMSNNITIISMKSVDIGEGCQIGDMVSLMDCDFHEIEPSTRNKSHGHIDPVVIGNNCWLGSRVMVLKGVTIGDNSVIAAGSVVTRSLPANVIAGGIPAKVIRQLDISNS